jgi:hypothetical protein
MEQVEKRGRPRVERADPDARTPVSIRLRGEIFNRINEAAKLNNRPLSLEIEHRLENSFNYAVVPAEDRDLMIRFVATYRHGGETAVLRLLLDLGEPDAEEREIRRLRFLGILQGLDPAALKSGLLAPEQEP